MLLLSTSSVVKLLLSTGKLLLSTSFVVKWLSVDYMGIPVFVTFLPVVLMFVRSTERSIYEHIGENGAVLSLVETQ